MEHNQKFLTIFQKSEISEPALFSPSNTTKKINNFPEICVSTFSENIIQKFSSLDSAKKNSRTVYRKWHDTRLQNPL